MIPTSPLMSPSVRLSFVLDMSSTITKYAAFVETHALYSCQYASLARRASNLTNRDGLVDGPRDLLGASHTQHNCYSMTPGRRGRSWFDFTPRSPTPPPSIAMAARRPVVEGLEVGGVRSRRDVGTNRGKNSRILSPKARDYNNRGNSNTSIVGTKGDPRRRAAAINAARRNDITFQQKAYLWRLKAAGREGVWRRIPSILLEMRSRGVPRNIYIFNAAIAALARCRRPAEAEALLTAMLDKDSVAPDKVSYNSAINAHARCGNLDAAHRLLGLMRARGVTSAVLRPDVITYNTVADAASKCGDAAAAVKVLAIMAEDGVQPDAITYNACLAACKAKGDLQRALVLLELMRGDGIAPDQRSYSAVIATAGKCGDWSRALDFMSEMKREGMTPDKVTFNTAIAAVGSNGQWEKAGSLLAEMKANGLKSDPVSYTSVLSACARAGEWRETVRLLRDMRASGVPPNAYSYSVAIDACGKAGRQDEALGLLEEMVRVGVTPDVVAYNSAIDACSVAGDHETALRLLREMKEGCSPSIPPPDVVSYGGAIAACARAGRADEALELVAELRANEGKASAAAVRGDLGVRHEEAVGREGFPLPLPNLVTYSSALFACLKAGEVARGGELLEEMIGAGIQPNDIHCETMVAAWAAAGEPEKAVTLVKRLRSHGFLPSLATYETLVWGFAQVADWEATVHILASVLRLGLKPSVRSWDAAIAACSQAGHWERALALLADMRRQGIKPSKVTYTAAVTGLNRPRYADWGPKLENLARMLQQPRDDDDHAAIPGESNTSVGMDGRECKGEGERRGPSHEDYDSSIEALGEAGDACGATCLLRVMHQEGFHASPRAYRSVIYACARVGHLTEAVTLARELENSRKGGGDLLLERGRTSPVPDVNASTVRYGLDAGAESTVVEELGLMPGRFVGDALCEETQPSSSPAQVSSVGNGVDEMKEGGDNSGEGEREREFDLDVVYNCIVCSFARVVTRSRGDDRYSCSSKSSSSSGIHSST